MPRANTKAWKRLPLSERKAIKDHEELLRQMACVVSHRTSMITLHHCHGGSLKELGIHVGAGQKQNHWLQIPLNWEWHTGNYGIDVIGVETWEKQFGTQVEFLKHVSRMLGYNVFEKAGYPEIGLEDAA